MGIEHHIGVTNRRWTNTTGVIDISDLLLFMLLFIIIYVMPIV